MENLLRDGDYVPNGFGGFTRLYGAQEVLAKALFKLTCRRGSFPFLQDLGSRLYELGRLRPSEREAAAKIYCEQALQGMGLTVDEVKLTQLPSGQASVEVCLTYQDEKQALEAVSYTHLLQHPSAPQTAFHQTLRFPPAFPRRTPGRAFSAPAPGSSGTSRPASPAHRASSAPRSRDTPDPSSVAPLPLPAKRQTPLKRAT